VQPKTQKAGYNLQLTKVTDIGGGHETLTINTALPPDATIADAHDRVKFMGKVMQARINEQREKELARQDEERQQFEKLTHATPVAAYEAPATNGHAE
jgi:hypothetical protein